MTVFPTSLIHFGVEPDIRKLMEDAEDIYRQTGVPLCPCCLFFPCGMIVCLPFCWIFALIRCTEQRESSLEKLAMDFNKEHKHEGVSLKFEDNGTIPIGLYVHLNVPKRREYCVLNGIAFQMPPIIPYPQPIIVPKSRRSGRSSWGFGGGGDGCGGDGGGGDGGGGCGGGD